MADEEFSMVEMPLVINAEITEERVVYLSNTNEFVDVIQIAFQDYDGDVYQFAVSLELARRIFNLPC